MYKPKNMSQFEEEMIAHARMQTRLLELILTKSCKDDPSNNPFKHDAIQPERNDGLGHHESDIRNNFLIDSFRYHATEKGYPISERSSFSFDRYDEAVNRKKTDRNE